MEVEASTRFVQAYDGVRLACYVTGSGPLDVVFSAYGPWPIDLVKDEPGFARLTRRLASCSRTIWLTPRGVGASGGDLNDCYDDPTIFDRDLTAVIEAFELERPTLVGHGVGGCWALRYAHGFPDRVASLIVIDGFAHYVQRADYPVGLPESFLDRFCDTAGEMWGTGGALAMTAPSRVSDTLFRERWARIERLGQSPDEHARTLRRAVLVDERAALPGIKVPTLVLHRTGDRFVRTEAARYLADHIPDATYVELPGDDHLFFVGDVDALADEIEEFLTGGHQAPEGNVITSTILFTDIVASTEQSAQLGHRRWGALTSEHDAAVRAILQRYRGHEVKTLGDGFLATFDATTRAVRAATDIVKAAAAAGLAVRAGVHTGEVEVRHDDVVGLPVSIAKRVCDTAGSGEVFVTEVVKLHAAGSDLVVSAAGTHTLKGVPGEWPLHRVDN